MTFDFALLKLESVEVKHCVHLVNQMFRFCEAEFGLVSLLLGHFGILDGVLLRSYTGSERAVASLGLLKWCLSGAIF